MLDDAHKSDIRRLAQDGLILSLVFKINYVI